ncbi:MAG: hypothetical protein BGO49_11480 [Planctomycetales bacterium 71-10]|nr:MAG: hypothetical protein BGO49_11480 [Planctomycetales bacterium 71-10]
MQAIFHDARPGDGDLEGLAGVTGQAKIGGAEVCVPAVDLVRGKTATSSADESSSFTAANVVDGNASTRWSSGQWMCNIQVGWLVIDLGAVYDIDRLRLDWEAAFGVDYQIQVSDDGFDWMTARDVVGAATGGVVEHANLNARGRYVRIYLTKSRITPTNDYSQYSVNAQVA